MMDLVRVSMVTQRVTECRVGKLVPPDDVRLQTEYPSRYLEYQIHIHIHT